MLQLDYALVLELVDRHAWGACASNGVEVQVFSGAPEIIYLILFMPQHKSVNYQLEPAGNGDVERIRKYKLASILDYAGDLNQAELDRINRYVDEQLPKQLGYYQNVICGGVTVGGILVRQIDDGLLLDEIFIEKKYRGRGIGSSVIKNILSCSNDSVFLWVYKANVDAIRLYRNLGFVVVDETNTRYYMAYSTDESSFISSV